MFLRCLFTMTAPLALPHALTHGDAHDLECAVQRQPVDLNQPVGKALPLVTVARRGDSAELLAVLIKHGADPRQAPLALLNAVHQNDAASVALLVAHGADPRHNGSEALEMAGTYGLTERFHQLVALGASEEDPRGRRGRLLLNDAQWGRVLDAVRRRNLDAYTAAWAALEKPPQSLALQALLLDIVGQPIEPGALASDTIALVAMLQHALPLARNHWAPLVETVATDGNNPPPQGEGPSGPVTAHALVHSAVLAGNPALVKVLINIPEVLRQVDADRLVQDVVNAEEASPSRWLALKEVLGDRPLTDAWRDQVGDALWDSLHRVAQGPRPALFNALLNLADGWDQPMDLTVMLLDAVVKPGSGCVKALAQRASPDLVARAMVNAVAKGHHRGYNDLWNEGRGWPLTGTPVEGFDETGPFPLEVLRAAIKPGMELSTLNWLTERGAQWLPHEATLRAAIGKNMPAWFWLDRQIEVERPVQERKVLERQAQATLQTMVGEGAAPITGRTRSRL